MTTRRGFITGLISFAVTAPAIVRATSLMPVKVMQPVLTLDDYLTGINELYGRGPMMDALPWLLSQQQQLRDDIDWVTGMELLR